MNEAEYIHLRGQIVEGAKAGVRRIIAEVCAKYNLSPVELTSRRRSREVAWPRHEVMWLAKKQTGASLPTIGKMLGGMDHTSVIYGIRAHLKRNPHLQQTPTA